MRPCAPVSRFLTAAALSAAALLPVSCDSDSATAGPLEVLTTNISNGDTWALNRPIVIYFNNALDPASVSFSSVQIRPNDPIIAGQPVTGSFELIPDARGNADHGLLFRPACPTNPTFTNGGLVPGGYNYQLQLPTQTAGGSSVLRDVDGRLLSVGLTRSFRTPPLSEPLFADTVVGPPQFVNVSPPDGLNLYSQGFQPILVTINQPIGTSPSNLGTNRIFMQYANSAGLFPQTGNIVPGNWLVVSNCGLNAELQFRPSGVLFPGRALRAVMTTDFEDLGGNTNNSPVFSDSALAPTLSELYAEGGGPAFNNDNVTVDELRDNYLDELYVDFEAPLPQPMADFGSGVVKASFEYPGPPMSPDQDFVVTANQGLLEIDTTTNTTVADGFGRVFPVTQGVLAVDDLVIEAGATLRLVGENPFILYATGQVTINGTLDASGFNGQTPTGFFRPDLPVEPGMGVLGGGRGGHASQVTDDFTDRAESGQGAFGMGGSGGKGGEGGYQQHNAVFNDINYLMVGGGGGGGFADTRTDSLWFDAWGPINNPSSHDNAGTDLRTDRHLVWTNGQRDPEEAFRGAEAGMRGSARDAQVTGDPPHGVHGFEDSNEDGDVDAEHDNDWDPKVDGYDENSGDYELQFPPAGTGVFNFGNPSTGPDGGAAGNSPFADVNPDNDFWGQRYYWDGVAAEPVLVTGELTAPWAGSGGGGSGDCQTVIRLDLDGDMFLDPINNFWPDANFPFGTTVNYWRGASGGGGGGQVQILAIGPISIGSAGLIRANGGSGAGGESTGWGQGSSLVSQVSGSGGGSGGHVVLQSATGLNLSAISVGSAGNPGIPATFFNNLNPANVVQAFGGRRGWAGAQLPSLNIGSDDDNLLGAENGFDGNSDFMVGRGGAGASGIIQVHVPDPAKNILFHPSVTDDFRAYMTMENPANPAVSERVDEILGLYGMPQPWALVPLFSSQSQLQSKWVDTGLADRRVPANGTGPFPDWQATELSFAGVDPSDGLVLRNGSNVAPGAVIAQGGGGATFAFDAYSLVLGNPSAVFDEQFLQNPLLLLGYEIIPSAAQLPAPGFEIVAVEYQAVPEVLTLRTRTGDGPMNLTGAADWQVRQRFFRIDTTSIKDRLPSTAAMRFQFQGTEETALGSGIPDPAQATLWTGDGATTLADLKGKRFIRYRVTFDIDALGTGASLGAEAPVLDYIKVPYAW